MQRRTPLKRGGFLRRGKPLAQESAKHKAKSETWAKIKAARVQRQVEVRGYTYCERCGRKTRHLELHHTEYAGRGGSWTDDNGELICAWPEPNNCHELEHGRPFQ